MNQCIFNIADYRPHFAPKTRREYGRNLVGESPSGFRIVTSIPEVGINAARRVEQMREASVLDIRLSHGAQRHRFPNNTGIHPCPAKILGFSSQISRHSTGNAICPEGGFDPMDFPPSAA
jgi:hypothetical protein